MRKLIILFLFLLNMVILASETPYRPGEIMLQLDPSFPTNEQIRVLENEFSEIDFIFERLLTRRMNIWLCSFCLIDGMMKM